MSSRSRSIAAVAGFAGMLPLLVLGACQQQDAPIPPAGPPGGQVGTLIRTSTLEAGPATEPKWQPNPYAGNAQAVKEGQALYVGMNCHGCHGALGGGGIGPPLADGEWIYGGHASQIYQSIAQGRPNGMPVFGDRLPAEVIWRIVAYVESLGGSESQATEGSTRGGAGGQADQEQAGRGR